ncbi:MAG: DUF2231 domain-containing protein, partial [Gemmatimonadales bacterium]
YDWPRLHAALNDLPTALLLVAVMFDLLAVVTKRPSFRQLGVWTMLVGAVGGGLAVLSGLEAEEHISHGDAVHRVMETHETLGLITLAVFGVLTLWRIVRERRMGAGERALSLGLSVVGVGFLFATAVFGGKLVFEHAAGIPTEVLQGEIQERTKGHHHDTGAAGEEAGSDSAAIRSGADHVDPPGAAPHSHEPDTPPHAD